MAPNSNPRFRLIPLRTIAGLGSAEWQLLWRALPLVVGIRTALWMMPLRRVRGVLEAGEPRSVRNLADVPASRLAWAVQAVSKRIPGATCLTQALALQYLLRRSGQSSEIRIGVAKDGEVGLDSHAWVMCGECVVLGGPEVSQYQPMLIWKAE